MKFLLLNCRHSSTRNIPSGEERGERDVFAGYKFFCVAIGFEIGTATNKSSKWPEQDSNPGLLDCESDVLTNSHTAGQVSLVLLSCSTLIAHINLALLSPLLCLDTLHPGMSLRSSRDQGFSLATISKIR